MKSMVRLEDSTHPTSKLQVQLGDLVNLSSSSMELHGALKELRILWDETKAAWNDPVRREFEQQFWEPFQAQILSTLRAVERLSPILEKVRNDCGEPRF